MRDYERAIWGIQSCFYQLRLPHPCTPFVVAMILSANGYRYMGNGILWSNGFIPTIRAGSVKSVKIIRIAESTIMKNLTKRSKYDDIKKHTNKL